MKKIDDIVDGLTEAEKKLHRDLIKECRERESSLEQMGESLRKNIEKLAQIGLNILLVIERFYKLSAELQETFRNGKKDIKEDSLETIPDERFFHA